jgi:tetratricopeptide (TPR) repeat protein
LVVSISHEPALGRAISSCEEGDRDWQAGAFGVLALTELRAGHGRWAADAIRVNLELVADCEPRLQVAAHFRLAEILEGEGNEKLVRATLQRAAAISDRAGYRWYRSHIAASIAQSFARSREWQAASDEFDRALFIARADGWHGVEAECLYELARIRLHLGDFLGARTIGSEAARVVRQLADPLLRFKIAWLELLTREAIEPEIKHETLVRVAVRLAVPIRDWRCEPAVAEFRRRFAMAH